MWLRSVTVVTLAVLASLVACGGSELTQSPRLLIEQREAGAWLPALAVASTVSAPAGGWE